MKYVLSLHIKKLNQIHLKDLFYKFYFISDHLEMKKFWANTALILLSAFPKIK